MSTTTLKDHGRHSEKHGDIAYYYAFPYRLYFGQHMISPDDVETWCTEHAVGYYKTSTYVHKDSTRVFVNGVETKEYIEKKIFVDKIYLQDPKDVIAIKLMFDVTDEKVSRPRIKLIRKQKALSKAATVAE